MPYILQDKRDELNPVIDHALLVLRGQESDDPNNDIGGNLNYMFTRILNACYGLQYRELAKAVSVLEMTKLEFYRKRVAPYENQKCHENGEVH